MPILSIFPSLEDLVQLGYSKFSCFKECLYLEFYAWELNYCN